MTYILIGLAAGAALCLGLYAVYSLFSEVPEQDTQYRDRPPSLFRMLWPLIILVEFNFGRILFTKKRLEQTAVLLRRAGQEYALTPRQFLSGRIVTALVGLALGWIGNEMTGMEGISLPAMFGLLGYFYPAIWLRDQTKVRNLQILKALPFFLDIVTLAVEAGLNLSNAMQQAVTKGLKGPLAVEINRVLRDTRGGKARIDALRDFADRLDFAPVTSLVSALIQAESMGSSLGPILRVQAEQRRAERFQRAEKMAMEAPVKMLGPLIMCIFPCTFIVLGFPIVVKFMTSGL
ncbi:type II secretion system F family protein [Ralstonia sp. UBA689]|uniref:type II secretion system F family protein n=1 Tax=Ralstonia sp. UBA689 TaxID=1947373 RepID=UPI0025E787F3|nr:type II secretion system F family protein [Ralstonia sp. UBA689]